MTPYDEASTFAKLQKMASTKRSPLAERRRLLNRLVLEFAKQLARENRFDDAIRLLEELPSDDHVLRAQSLDLMARVFVQDRAWEQAHDAWQKAAQLDSTNTQYQQAIKLLTLLRSLPLAHDAPPELESRLDVQAGSGWAHERFAKGVTHLFLTLGAYVESKHYGVLVLNQMMSRPDPTLAGETAPQSVSVAVMVPVMVYIGQSRWDTEGAAAIALPDLAIDIVRRGQSEEQVKGRVTAWMKGGTKYIWVFGPGNKQLREWRNGALVPPEKDRVWVKGPEQVSIPFQDLFFD